MTDERMTMGILPIRHSKAGFVLSTTDAVTVVAAIVFIAGVLAAWQYVTGMFASNYEFDLSLFGLVAGPALVMRTGTGYWTSLIIFTGDAILSVASLIVLMFMAWEKLIGNGTPWGFLESSVTAIVVLELILSLWAVMTLRRSDVRAIFRV
jgi:hypothetical protein